MSSIGRGRGRGRGLSNSPKINSPPGGGLTASSVSSGARTPPIVETVVVPEPPALQLPEKPGLGKSGREIKLITNHYVMKMPSTTTLFHYDFSVEQGNGRNKIVWTSGKARGLPRNEIRDRCYNVYMKWAADCRLNLYEMVYDRQKNLYCLNDLEELGHQTTKTISCKGETYYVTVTLCNPATITLSPQTIGGSIVESASSNAFDRSPLQILDLITNQFMFYMYALGKSDFMHFGRYFYRPMYDSRSRRYHELALGRMIYEGFFKSLRLVMGPSPPKELNDGSFILTMNFDSKHAPFFKEQPLLETVMATLCLRGEPRYPLDDSQIKCLNHHLKEVRVRTTHNKKRPMTFVLCPFTNIPGYKQTFKIERRENNVLTYMEEKYGIKTRFPFLPCVRKRGAPGGPGQYSYFPIECCEVVPHQKVDLKKTAEDQSKELIKVSAVPPEMRLQEIKKTVRYTDESPHGDENFFARSFGVVRNKELMAVNGRILIPPRILYNEKDRNCLVEVRNGQWNVQNQRLYMPAEIGKFAVVGFANQNALGIDLINSFVKNLINCAQNFGVRMPNDFVGDYCKDEACETVLRSLAAKDFKFFICILGDHVRGDSLRNLIKLCEVKYTIITQCVRARTLVKCANQMNNDTYKNLIYKINAKNGGVNNELHLSDPVAKKWLRPGVMFIGLDVNHPPPLSKAEINQGILPREPSVVGAVANSGKTTNDYRIKFYLQDARKEEIEERHMIDMVKTFVDEYAENHNKLRPDTILVYRDGVSEGQFRMVTDKEIMALRQGLACISPSYNPKLTVLTVQKRHNNRFFKESLLKEDPERLRTLKNAEKNIPAGTVVDTGPVSAKLYDFFLCSHVGIQGTAKPSYYVVMLDENKLGADELQTLTFLLCHGYQRCSKSVSLPAPVYHAHHAASRGKMHYMAETSNNDDSSSGFSSGSSDNSSSLNRQPAATLNYDLIQSKIQYGPLNRVGMIWM